MKKSKNLFIVIGVILLIVVLAQIFGNDSSNDAGDNSETTNSSISSVTKSDDSNIMDSTGTIGDYMITIKSAVLAYNYNDEPSIIITYDFTNNSDDAKAFLYAVSDKLFQDGIECESTISAFDDDTYSSENQMKEIKTGVTLEVQKIYKLNNETSDVQVEVSEWLSFSKNPPTIVKTYSIAE